MRNQQLNEVRYCTKYPMGTNSFGLSCEDVQDKDEWRLCIKVQAANSGLPAKWTLKHMYSVHVYVCMLHRHTTFEMTKVGSVNESVLRFVFKAPLVYCLLNKLHGYMLPFV